jgi:hypothetical protein
MTHTSAIRLKIIVTAIDNLDFFLSGGLPNQLSYHATCHRLLRLSALDASDEDWDAGY